MLATISLMMFAMGATAEPSNWECATPLIQKNYDQPYKVAVLAARIADECATPYSSDIVVPNLEALEHGLYDAKLALFRQAIESRINALRLRDRVPLKR